MGNLIQFVDTIAASPTVRLNVNDETTWWCERFDAPTPRLRRASAVNALRDGINVSSSLYDARTLYMDLRILAANQDAAATELQKLFRELDRETNLLKYQPTGSTKPVFFRLSRSDASAVTQMIAQAAGYVLTVELLAEPFALGLREDLAALSFTNAAIATSGALCYKTVTGVIGDVAAPVVAWAITEPDTSADWYLVRSDREPVLVELEGWTNGTNTTTVSGDASLSNSGGKSISFGTPTLTTRASLSSIAQRLSGSYRVLLQARSSSGALTCDFEVLLTPTGGTGVLSNTVFIEGVSVPGTTNTILDLGILTLPEAMTGSTELETEFQSIDLLIARTAGAGNLVIDFLALIPCDGPTESAMVRASYAAGSLTAFVADGVLDREYAVNTTSGPFAAGADVQTTELLSRSGSYPMLKPNTTNHLVLIRYGVSGISTGTVLNMSYWPRYLVIRPSAT